MVNSGRRSSDSYKRARVALAGRLRDRFFEIEHAVLTRIRAIAPVDENADPEYIHGLREAIRAAIDFTLRVVEAGSKHMPPVPVALLAQARIAARHQVGLSTVLRRYTAGSGKVNDYVIQEAENDREMQGENLRHLVGELNAVHDRLLGELEAEYLREPQSRFDSSDAVLVDRIRRLLAGESVDTSDLNYDFDGMHLGIVAQGPGAGEALRDLSRVFDGRLLSACPTKETVWGWIGTHRRIDHQEFMRRASARRPNDVTMALGEPGTGSSGWCLTYEQAIESFPFALRESRSLIRYSDIALTAAIERDPLASASLRQLYLVPLEQAADGGHKLRVTLRAYFDAGWNSAAAGAVLGVTRQAVHGRLRTAEGFLGAPLVSCGPLVDAALRLHPSA